MINVCRGINDFGYGACEGASICQVDDVANTAVNMGGYDGTNFTTMTSLTPLL